jgi:aspartate/methionine/tyrosine aminotransferase
VADLPLADEPYRNLVFDGNQVPWLPPLYEHTLILTSYSKDLGLAGERIGYAAVSPRAAEAAPLLDALVLANRVLGFVNAQSALSGVSSLGEAPRRRAVPWRLEPLYCAGPPFRECERNPSILLHASLACSGR